MKQVIRRAYKNKFARSVAVVATGTAGAQAINMLFTPLLTRLYGPEAFGLLGTFVSLLAMAAPLVALSYPIAIVLPRSDKDAKGLVQLSLRIALITSLLAMILLILFNDWVVDTLQVERVAEFLYLLPLAMFFTACLAVGQQWIIRKKFFKLKARIAVLQALWLNLAKSGAGLINPLAAVLILLGTFASALHAVMIFLGLKRYAKAGVQQGYTVDTDNNTDETSISLRGLAKRHYDFAIYRTPQVFLNAVSQSLPVLMLASFFGPAAAGFYTLSKTVLALPITVIGGAIASVFYPHINEAVLAGRNPHKPLAKATLALAGIGCWPFIIVGLFGPVLFSFIFGAEWEIAGEYARWLSLWYFFGFINRPSVGAIAVLRLQKFFLLYEVASVLARVAGLYIGFVVFNDALIAVAIFSVISAAMNFMLVSVTLAYAKRFQA